MIKRRSALRRRLSAIRAVQAIYMPCVPAMLAAVSLEESAAAIVTSRHGSTAAITTSSHDDAAHGSANPAHSRHGDFPEDEQLFLPHNLTPTERAGCAAGLAAIEERVRDAQLHETLDRLRLHLHIKARLVTFKNRNVRAQRPNTRARGQINTNEQRIVWYANKYRAARKAKLALAGDGAWCTQWRELACTDVRTLLAEDDPVNAAAIGRATTNEVPMLSEGRRQTSWIWRVAANEARDTGEDGTEGDSMGMQDGASYHTSLTRDADTNFVAVRVEYLKARARAARFSEQQVLLTEEKRRVLKTLEYEAVIWKKREKHTAGTTAAETEGLTAYAARQALLRLKLRADFARIWGETIAPIPTDDPGFGGDMEDAAAALSDSSDDEIESDVEELLG